VLIAVRRDRSIISVREAGPWGLEAATMRWRDEAEAAGASEIHVHLIAATAEERRAMSAYAAKGDYYGLLGLTALNLAATDAQIRSAHTRQVKRFHPDKAKSGSGGGSEGAEGDADAENVFLQLNNAFEAMIVPEKRRAFDSTYEFDDSIPTDAKAAKGDFFALFGPVFERNARFSSIQPVPKLGGPQDDDAAVKAFYNFWANFDSWRVFTHTGPNKLTGSEGREERRHLEKENLAAAAKAKK
jgi:DnaJ family protein C protein 2